MERRLKKITRFLLFGHVVAEDGAARADVNVRIQKARGSFSKLRKVWLSTSI
jgi:Asp-tRNA(Asn)/Glu-tRNA(Gln) amidotransferase B subunit